MRQRNFPDLESFQRERHFFIVPPGDVASPFLSEAPAVPAPCVLASFGEGLEAPVVAPAAPSFLAAPFMSSPAVVFDAGPLSCGLPACASTAVLASARAAASKIDFIFIVISRLVLAPPVNCGCPHPFQQFLAASTNEHKGPPIRADHRYRLLWLEKAIAIPLDARCQAIHARRGACAGCAGLSQPRYFCA